MSAPMFELQLKNRELQKHLFDFIGAGTITPDFLIQKKFEEDNKTLDLEYFAMEKLYKEKSNYTDLEIKDFVEENKDQLKREYIDFKYVVLNPKNLIGLEEFNQEFFDEIDKIENKISLDDTFDNILKNINININKVKKYAPTSTKKINEDRIYSQRTSDLDLIENGENFLLYSITNKYDQGPNLDDKTTKEELRELVYQKGKFDFNRSVLEEIQKKEFDDSKFLQMSNSSIESISLNSVRDNDKFEPNSVKILYSLPIGSFTLVNDKENIIYLVKLVNSKKNTFNKTDDDYLKFVNDQNTNNRKSILQSYDQLLNTKYQVQLNQKTIDRVKKLFQMIINRSFKDFKFRHRSKKNQIIYTSKKVKNNNDVLNLIDNFLTEKNSFIFESVEKGKIKGRYTIFGKNPDKIWEFNNNNSFLIKNNKRTKLEDKPDLLIEKIIENFKFETPKKLPKICSLISGYFSYDSIRYIEKIPNNCKNDLNLPDVRLLRPRTLVIYDNLKKEIFYIINIFNDEKIKNYQIKYEDIKIELSKLLIQSSSRSLNSYQKQTIKEIKVKSNTPKNKFLKMVGKAKEYIKLGDVFQVVLSQRFEAKLTKKPLDIYKKLRITNPSPFMFFLILVISK